jgi:osmotically-inducible protein OsmY
VRFDTGVPKSPSPSLPWAIGTIPDATAEAAPPDAAFILHPARLDGALQGLFALLDTAALPPGTGLVPVKAGRLLALADGAPATVIEASLSAAAAYKGWIAGSLAPQGALVVDAGAAGVMVAEDRRTVGTMTEDEGIEQKASNRINEKIKDAHINVTSYNRMLLLTGEVPTAAAKACLSSCFSFKVRSRLPEAPKAGAATPSARAGALKRGSRSAGPTVLPARSTARFSHALRSSRILPGHG